MVHGGTYNGQAVAMAACVATLRRLNAPGAYDGMAARGTRLMDGIRDCFAAAGIPASVAGFPQIFHVALGLDAPARDWADLRRMDRARYVAFTTALLRRGVRRPGARRLVPLDRARRRRHRRHPGRRCRGPSARSDAPAHRRRAAHAGHSSPGPTGAVVRGQHGEGPACG